MPQTNTLRADELCCDLSKSRTCHRFANRVVRFPAIVDLVHGSWIVAGIPIALVRLYACRINTVAHFHTRGAKGFGLSFREDSPMDVISSLLKVLDLLHSEVQRGNCI